MKITRFIRGSLTACLLLLAGTPAAAHPGSDPHTPENLAKYRREESQKLDKKLNTPETQQRSAQAEKDLMKRWVQGPAPPGELPALPPAVLPAERPRVNDARAALEATGQANTYKRLLEDPSVAGSATVARALRINSNALDELQGEAALGQRAVDEGNRDTKKAITNGSWDSQMVRRSENYAVPIPAETVEGHVKAGIQAKPVYIEAPRLKVHVPDVPPPPMPPEGDKGHSHPDGPVRGPDVPAPPHPQGDKGHSHPGGHIHSQDAPSAAHEQRPKERPSSDPSDHGPSRPRRPKRGSVSTGQ